MTEAVLYNHYQNCNECKKIELSNKFKIIKVYQQEELLSLETLLIH